MNDPQVLQTITERMCQTFQVQRIVLFGSRAKGQAAVDSDYDVLVVAESAIPFVQRQGLALKALGNRSFSVDLLVYTPNELERESSLLGSAVYWALNEGTTVYAA